MGTRNVTPKAYKYVNRMLNVIYLTGFVVKSNKAEGWFVVAQTVNEVQDIVVHMEPGDSRIPSLRRMVTATCHVWGKRFVNPKTKGSENPEELSGLHLKAIDVSQANILNIPSAASYFGKVKNRGASKVLPKKAGDEDIKIDESRIPYDDKNELKTDVAETVNLNETDSTSEMLEVIHKIIEASGGKFNTNLGHNANVVFVAGCVEKAYIKKGNEYSSKDRLEIVLRQCEKEDESLFIRYEPDSGPAPQAYASRIKKGYPIKVVGEIRVKPILNEEGDVLGTHCYIRAREIYSAEVGIDIQRLPEWWIEKARLMSISDKRDQQRKTLDALEKNEPLPERHRSEETAAEKNEFGW